MSNRLGYLDHLAAVPLFAALSYKELQKIAGVADEITLEEGRVLVEQGSTGHEAFVIIDGTAQVYRNGNAVATLGVGDTVGELALLDGGPRTASVVAMSPLTVLVLGQREFRGILDEVPELANKVLAELALRVRNLDEHAYG